jgi:hypothetical protein
VGKSKNNTAIAPTASIPYSPVDREYARTREMNDETEKKEQKIPSPLFGTLGVIIYKSKPSTLYKIQRIPRAF